MIARILSIADKLSSRVSRAGSCELGLTLTELLVSMSIGLLVSGGAASVFLNSTHHASDNDLIITAQENARSILDRASFDLRMLGAGMPTGQTDFSPTDATLGTAPLALFLDSDEDYIRFRFNEYGDLAFTSDNFEPFSGDLNFTVSSASDLYDGAEIYLSDSSVGGNDGMRAVVTNVTGNSITISGSFTASADATFPAGSIISRVSTVQLDSPSSWSGVTRTVDSSTVTLAPNTKFSIEYLDRDLNVLTPPLSASTVEDSLSAVKITAYARTERALRSGSVYTATAEQTISFRNLIVNR